MPYGIQALARYKGRLENEAMLPADGNAIGDAWAVGDNFWIRLLAPGAARADWIDP
jgi:hypothetical protein